MRVQNSLLAALMSSLPLALCASLAQARDAKSPCAVPAELQSAPAYAGLTAEYARLVPQRDDVNVKIVQHNAVCDVELEEGSAAEVACGQAQATLSAELDRHDGEVAAHNALLRSTTATAMSAVEARLDRTRTLLKAVPTANARWGSDIEAWVDLSEDARRDAQIAAALASVDLVLDALKTANAVGKAAAQADVDEVKKWIEQYGATALSADALKLARDQLRTVRTWGDLITLVQTIFKQHKDFYGLVRPLMNASDPTSKVALFQAGGKALIYVLKKIGKAYPLVAATSNAASLWVDVGYGWTAYFISKARIKEITVLQQASYDEVKRLSASYIADYQRLKSLRQAANACR